MKGANLEKCPFDLTPYKLGANTSRPQIFSLNYTNQDFWSMKARLVSYIKEKFGTEFNDFVESMGYYVESYDAGTFFILPV